MQQLIQILLRVLLFLGDEVAPWKKTFLLQVLRKPFSALKRKEFVNL